MPKLYGRAELIQQALIDSPRNDYPPTFEQCWQAYPKRAGGNPKRSAFQQFQRRLSEGIDPQDILAGVERYAAFCEATGKLGTEVVMMARTFWGPDCRFEEDWELPADLNRRQPWAQVPKEDDKLWPWAKEHGYPNPGDRTYYTYRKMLWEFVEKRLAELSGGSGNG